MKTDHELFPDAIIRHLDYGIAYITLNEGQIVLFTNKGNMSRDAIDYWWGIYEEMVQTWPEDRPVLIIYDLTHPDVVFTPYLRGIGAQARELLLHADRFAYVATVVTDSFNYRIVSMLLNQFSHHTERYYERIFHSNEAALEWLRPFLVE